MSPVDVAAVVHREGPGSQGLLTRRQLAAAGVSAGSLARALEAGTLVRVSPAVYGLAPLPGLPRHLVTGQGVAPEYVARARAALLSLPSAVARGRTAAVLRGWGLLVEPSRVIEVAVPHRTSCSGTSLVRPVRSRRLSSEQVVVLAGTAPLPLLPASAVLTELAVTRPLLEAVVVCDSALRAGDVSVDGLVAAADRLTGRAAVRFSAVLELLDDQAGSVLESVQRVAMLLAGVTGFESQLVVRDRPPLRVDFAFRAAGLVVEVDGARWHPDPARDRSRDNALAALGWRVLRYTWAQVVHQRERVLAEITDALGRGRPGPQLVREGLVSAA